MAINKISGNILADNLVRGSDLAFQTDLIYLDIANDRIGVKTASPADDFTVLGVANASNVRITSATANGIFIASASLLAETTTNLTFDGTQLAVVGNLSSGNIDIGSNTFVTTGNVTGGNIFYGSGDVSGTGNVYAGNFIGNISGNIDAGGANTDIQFNNNNVLDGSSAFTFDFGSNLLTLAGTANVTSLNVSNTAQITGNVTAGNISTSNLISGGTLETSGNALIGGNLIVQGNITYINIDDLQIEDPLIVVGTGPNGAPLTVNDGRDRGTQMNYFVTAANLQQSAFMGYDNSAGNMIIATNVTVASDIVTVIEYGNLVAGNLYAETVAITGDFAAANITATGTISAAGNVTGANLITSGLITATGNVAGGNLLTTGAVTATGNVTGGNIETSGLVTATGNVTGGNLVTAGLVTATGNVTGGNIETSGLVTAIGNVTGGNLLTVGQMSAAGNVTGGNVETAGLITATGNVTGGNVLTGGEVSATGNVTTLAVITNTIDPPSGNLSLEFANIIQINDITSSGNISAATGEVSGATVSAAGNVTAGNVVTSGFVTATGNVTGGNLVTAGLITATGNVIGNNFFSLGLISAQGNVITPAVVTSLVTTSSGDLTLDSASGVLQWDGSGNIVMNSQWINNLADPTQAYDAATKQYVDDAVSSGIHIHTPVDVETPVGLPAATYTQGGNTYTVTDTIAGNTVVFSTAANLQVNDQLWFANSFSGVLGNTAYFVVSTPNTSAAVLSTTYNGSPVANISNSTGITESVTVNSGIGATLTATANGALTVDGFSVSAGNRILVYQQSNAVENGVYSVTDAGNVSAPWVLTRAVDSDTYIPDTNDGLDQGSYYYVKYGNTGAGESYVLTQPTGPFIIGYANIEFTQFSASQVYSANTAAGLVLTGTIFSAKVDNDTTAFDGNGNIIVKAGANLVTPNIGAATGTSLSLTGNLISANVNTGIVSATSNVVAGNLSTTGVVSAAGNVVSLNVNTGIVSATGNAVLGNVSTSGIITATGNVTGGNLLTSGDVSAAGNITGANLTVGNATIGNASISGDITVNSLTSNTYISAQGNVIAGNVETTGTIFANLDISTGSAVSAAGNVSGNNIISLGVITAVGNVTGGNIITSGTVSATGNVLANNITATALVQATSLTVTSLANIGNLEIANTTITTDGTLGNIVVRPTGTGLAVIDTTTGLVLPTGNTAQRPSPATTGTVRFNTTLGRVELYDGAGWEDLVANVTNQTLSGDGSTTTFTLDRDSTTAATLVMLNGLVQLPATAYTVTGNSLNFTQAPTSSDTIDIRFL